MRFWTILALLVAVCAVFLGVGHTEETADDIREVALEDAENDEGLPDSFESTESEDDDDDDDDKEPGAADKESDGNTLTETEHALESVNETPSNNQDESAFFKRTPWRRRRRRRRRRRFFRRFRLRRVANKFCKYARYHPKFAVKCRLYHHFGDEESPGSKNKEQNEKNDPEWLGEE